jgi:hypothetical protein
MLALDAIRSARERKSNDVLIEAAWPELSREAVVTNLT